MSASPVEIQEGIRLAYRYTLVTILCALFSAVYELFSHGVYAYGMLYAFAIPLVGGALPVLLLLKHGIPLPHPVSMQLWHYGISALTVGSLFSGALEIYGTTSQLTVAYWLAGGAFLVMAVLAGLFVPVNTKAAMEQ